MPVINRGDDYFAVVTYTGNGTSQTISGLRFQPDFVWIKGRSGATDHALYDAQRGVQNRLESNTTDAAVSSDNGVTAFNADGFSIGSLAQVNTNGATYVAWCWKEGATQGFDIVTYTGDGVDGRTVAHNLGVVPSMVIVKSRSTATNWNVKHTSLSSNNIVELNTTSAQNTPGSGYIGDLNSSTTFTLKNGGAAITNVNGNGTTYVAYLFAEVAGFSKFGKYTGNGSADGPFCFTGFLPRWIMIKRTDTTSNWIIIDTERSPYNQTNQVLLPNSSAAEGTGAGYGAYDFLSNGFKPRNVVANETNVNGGTYVYACFASNPFKHSLAR